MNRIHESEKLTAEAKGKAAEATKDDPGKLNEAANAAAVLAGGTNLPTGSAKDKGPRPPGQNAPVVEKGMQDKLRQGTYKLATGDSYHTGAGLQ